MQRSGFIFSLDAFVAFTLIMVTVSLLIFTIGTPKPYYPSLEQAHTLAHDTLEALATSSPSAGSPTYLEKIISAGSTLPASPIIIPVAGGDDAISNPMIPKGFGYRLETVNINDGTTTLVYDSKIDPNSDRYKKDFSKLQASSTIFTSIYSPAPIAARSPYCYFSCHGFDPNNPTSDVSNCSATPCDSPKSTLLPWQNSIQIVRLVVYT